MGNILQNVWKKEVCLFSWDYLIKHIENEDENERQIT